MGSMKKLVKQDWIRNENLRVVHFYSQTACFLMSIYQGLEQLVDLFYVTTINTKKHKRLSLDPPLFLEISRCKEGAKKESNKKKKKKSLLYTRVRDSFQLRVEISFPRDAT